MVEVAVACAVLFLALVPLFNSLAAGARYTGEYRRGAVALHVAQGKMEDLLAKPFGEVVSEPPGADLSTDAGALPVYGHLGYAYKVFAGQEVDGIKEVRVAVYYSVFGRQHRVLLTAVKSRR